MDLGVILGSGAFAALATVCTISLIAGTYKNKIDTLDKNFEKIDSRLLGIIERIAKLESGLERDREHSRLVQSKSPLTLTDQGKVVLLDSHGKDFVDENLDKLIKEIRQYHPKSAYDVQEISRKVIEENSSTDEFIPIKDYTFAKGKNLKDVIEVIGIYLRDIALKELGFDITDLK